MWAAVFPRYCASRPSRAQVRLCGAKKKNKNKTPTNENTNWSVTRRGRSEAAPRLGVVEGSMFPSVKMQHERLQQTGEDMWRRRSGSKVKHDPEPRTEQEDQEHNQGQRSAPHGDGNYGDGCTTWTKVCGRVEYRCMRIQYNNDQ